MQLVLDKINGVLWSNIMIALALIVGIYYTVRLKGAQFRYMNLMKKYMFEKVDTGSGRTPFQSVMTTLSGRVGTGNIAGVATAIFVGGPGAVFWMWLSAILGSGTAIAEAALSQVYKVKDGTEYRGGTQYFIEKGLGMKKYAMAFAICSIFALGICTPGIQGNAIADSMNVAFGFNKQIIGVIVAAITALVIAGGIKRISQFAEVVAPVMAGAYILVAVIIIVLNIKAVPSIIGLIFSSAFGANQVFAAVIGNAVTWGMKRGIYSNEAGNGISSHASASAEVSHPVKSGFAQSGSVIIDTLFVCTATAVMILITQQYNVEGIVTNLSGIQPGPGYVQLAIDTFVKGFGSIFVALAMFFFSLTTIMANYYSAECGVVYVCEKAKGLNQKLIVNVLRLGTIAAVIAFASQESMFAWALGDVGVGLMAWLSFVALLLLGNTAVKVYNDFMEQYKRTGDAIFEPEKLGIKNTEAWDNADKWKKASTSK